MNEYVYHHLIKVLKCRISYAVACSFVLYLSLLLTPRSRYQSRWPNPGCGSRSLRNSDVEDEVTCKSNLFDPDDMENTEN